MTSLFPRDENGIGSARNQKPSSSKRERHSSTTLQQPMKKLTIDQSDYICNSTRGGGTKTKGRYQTDKKP